MEKDKNKKKLQELDIDRLENYIKEKTNFEITHIEKKYGEITVIHSYDIYPTDIRINISEDTVTVKSKITNLCSLVNDDRTKISIVEFMNKINRRNQSKYYLSSKNNIYVRKDDEIHENLKPNDVIDMVMDIYEAIGRCNERKLVQIVRELKKEQIVKRQAQAREEEIDRNKNSERVRNSMCTA